MKKFHRDRRHSNQVVDSRTVKQPDPHEPYCMRSADSDPSMRRRSGLGMTMLAAACLWVAACADSPPSIDEIQSLHKAGRYTETIEPLRALVQQEPDDPQRLFLYGKALWSSGNPGLALWALKGAMEDPEYLIPAGKLFVNALILNEAWDDAEKTSTEMLEKLGDNPEILTLRAYARQGSRKNYEGAIEDAERVLDLDPDNTEVLIPRTVSLLALKRVDEAGEALRELDELYRDESLGLKGSAKFCTAGATFAMEKGEDDIALERFERCLEEFPGDSILLPKAMAFFDERKDLERSLEILKEAVELQPESQSLRDSLALRLETMGRREEALETLREATTHEAMIVQIRAWSSLASFQASIGEPDEALVSYEKTLALLSSRSPDIDFRYADALIQAGRYEDALAWADQMSVDAQRSLIKGRALLALGEPVNALEHFGEANRLWPNNAVARYYTALAAERVGKFDRAIEEYRYSMRIDPAATDAALRLAAYYAAQGEGASAISVLSTGADHNAQAFEMQLMIAQNMARFGYWNNAPKPFVESLATPQLLARSSVAVAEGLAERTDVATAVAYLEGVSRLDLTHPRDAVALEQMVKFLPEIGRAADALRLACQARDRHPEAAAFHALCAEALARAEGDPAEVVIGFEKALELDESQPVALRGLARTLASLGTNDDRAEQLYRKAIELDARDAQAVRELARFLRARNQPEAAIPVLEGLVNERPWDADATLELATWLRESGGESHLVRAEALARRVQELGGQELGQDNASEAKPL